MTDEEPLLLRTEKGFTAVWKTVQLYPPSDPVEYARRKARAASLAPGTLVFVPSVGLGYGLAELLERLPSGCSVLCVEAHQQIMGLAMARGLPQDPRLLILRTESDEAVSRALREMGPGRFRRLVEVPLSAGYRLAPSFYGSLRRRIETEIREHWRNRLTLIALGSLQIRNTLSNLAFLPGARDFARLSTARPVVVAGAGPSLDDMIPALRSVRDRLLLVAVDTALPRLMAESLAPDLVVALEAQTANLEDFLGPLHPGTLLACDLSSHPAVPRLFAGRVFFFSSAFAPLRLFARLADARLLPCSFPPLGSVGVAAVHAALRLTSGRVFLSGLDFSFPRGLTHARGTPRHVAWLAAASRLKPAGSEPFQLIAMRGPFTTEDKNGRPVETDSVLRSYRDGLAKTLVPERERVYDMGSTGLDLGARRATSSEMKELVLAAPLAAERLQGTEDLPFSGTGMRAFLSAEARILAGGQDLLREALRTGTPSAECLGFLREADYAWIHFPDAPETDTLGTEAPGRSFLARAGVAVRYYGERLARLGSLL